jgi:acyl-CoA dehydrogenase
MTDGATTAIKASGNRELIDRALPHFLSRDARPSGSAANG